MPYPSTETRQSPSLYVQSQLNTYDKHKRQRRRDFSIANIPLCDIMIGMAFINGRLYTGWSISACPPAIMIYIHFVSEKNIKFTRLYTRTSRNNNNDNDNTVGLRSRVAGLYN